MIPHCICGLLVSEDIFKGIMLDRSFCPLSFLYISSISSCLKFHRITDEKITRPYTTTRNKWLVNIWYPSFWSVGHCVAVRIGWAKTWNVHLFQRGICGNVILNYNSTTGDSFYNFTNLHTCAKLKPSNVLTEYILEMLSGRIYQQSEMHILILPI